MKRAKVTVTVPEEGLADFINYLKLKGIPWTVIKPVRDSAVLAGEVYRLLEQGHAVRAISQRTSLSKSTVSRIGRNPDKYGLNKSPIKN